MAVGGHPQPPPLPNAHGPSSLPPPPLPQPSSPARSSNLGATSLLWHRTPAGCTSWGWQVRSMAETCCIGATSATKPRSPLLSSLGPCTRLGSGCSKLPDAEMGGTTGPDSPSHGVLSPTSPLHPSPPPAQTCHPSSKDSIPHLPCFDGVSPVLAWTDNSGGAGGGCWRGPSGCPQLLGAPCQRLGKGEIPTGPL